jgi:hypothetical protein
MGRRLVRRCLSVLALCAVVSQGKPSRAATTPTDPSVYVSDQFKTVAARVFTQLATNTIEQACPRDQVLCARVATRLGEAFSAALSNNKTALTSAIDNLFIDTSVAAALQLSVGSMLPRNPDDKWSYGVPPLVDCIVANMAGHSHSKSCKLSNHNARWVTALFDEVISDPQNQYMPDADKKRIAVVWKQALQKPALIDPEAALEAFAALSSSEAIDRQDRRVYLLTLANLAAEGLNGGLFSASYAYLVDAGNAEDPLTAETDILNSTVSASVPARLPYNFLMTSQDASIQALLASSCPSGAAAYAAWTHARDRDGNIFGRWRGEMLEGGPLELDEFDALVQAVEDCTDASRQTPLVSLRDNLSLFQGELKVIDFTDQYALPVLAGAALLDFVRTRDSTQLENNVRALLLYASTRIVQFVANGNLRGFPVFSTARDVLRSCEYQALEQTFGLPVTLNRADPRHCYSLLDLANDTKPASTCPAAPQANQPPPRCPTHDVPAAKTSYTPTDIAGALQSIEQKIKPLESAGPSLHNVVTSLNVNDLARALTALEAGDKDGATRALVRLGVDFLVNTADDLSASFLGVTDPECERDTKSQSIFSGLGAACAVRLLLQAAYRPVADWYLQQGGNSTSESTLATSVYENLINSPALDSTPIILNVGLGGTFVAGSSDTWGNGYAAMTLLDKIGLAFYKYNWKAFRFETGPFAGGFLDALIRTAAGDGTSQRYWLLGYTAGFPRMWSTDLGLEMHLAAAMPFTLSESNHYGFAIGGAIVVPFNFVFQQGGQ